LSTSKDDEAKKDSNNEEIHSRKASDALVKVSNALTGMTVAAAAGSEKDMM
jgi:hypothetical protein